jgi:hypothetical protein
MRNIFTRSIATAVAAATIVTSIPLSQAVAASSAAPAVATAAPVTSDFSARRYYRRGGGNAAALGAFAAIIGTIGAVALAQQRNDDYGRYGYYGNGNGYGYGAPVPYGYYGYRRW